MSKPLPTYMATGEEINPDYIRPVHELPSNLHIFPKVADFDYTDWPYDGYGSLGKCEMQNVAQFILDHCFYHGRWVGISWYDMVISRVGGWKGMLLKAMPRQLFGLVPEYEEDEAMNLSVNGLFGLV